MFIDLTNRSYESELMDNPEVDEKALHIALSDISRVNKWLGGSSITTNAVFDHISNSTIKKEWVVMDLGCGDGEMLRQLARDSRKKGISLKLIGVDNHAKCLAQATTMSTAYPEITFHNEDVLTLSKQQYSCDIIICTLTLHHFRDEDIKKVLAKSIELVSDIVIINDIHRTRWTYYLFKLFSIFFIKGYIAKNDGLVSIKRGFKKKELIQLAHELQLKTYRLDWKWAFRYRWIISNL